MFLNLQSYNCVWVHTLLKFMCLHCVCVWANEKEKITSFVINCYRMAWQKQTYLKVVVGVTLKALERRSLPRILSWHSMAVVGSSKCLVFQVSSYHHCSHVNIIVILQLAESSCNISVAR